MKHKDITIKALELWRDDPKGRPKFNIETYSCGTVKCAVGYLASLKLFQDLGLVLKDVCSDGPGRRRFISSIKNDSYVGVKAEAVFFGIAPEIATYLFHVEAYGPAPTLQNVIDRIEAM